VQNKKLFYINLIYYIAIISVAIVFVLGYLDVFKSNILTTILLQIVIITAIPIILYSLLVSKSVKQTFSDFGFKKLSGTLLGFSIVIALVLYFLNVFVAESFASIIHILGFENVIPALSISNQEVLSEFILTACLPGFCEEILHRGMMLNGCKKHGFTRYGLIFSSLLFGLMHLNILQFFYATILGVFMGISVLATESIWTGVIIHFTNNFLSIYFSFNKGWPLQNLERYISSQFAKLNPIVFVITTSCIMILLIYIFKLLISKIYKYKFNLQAEKLAEVLKTETENLTSEERVEEINKRLNELSIKKLETIKDNNQSSFVDKIFLYSSICLGSFATIFSFIVGIL